MRQRTLWAAMLSAGLLAACGGGGSDGGGDSGGVSPPAPAATVSLSGAAAKGLMANAIVTAHAVKADGSIDAAPLASTTTDANGRYTLTFEATQSRPYVIRVAAKSDGTTTHMDEVTGVAQPLPASFAMRSLFVPTGTGTQNVAANVTPFSEMAVAAAEKASGGLTATNAATAVSTVTQLLGFDPTTVEVRSTGTAITPDEQKLAILLTAVSKLANSGGLGCAAGSGDAAKCVVERLAAAASATTMKLEAGGVDVSGALVTAITTVMDDPRLRGSVNTAIVAPMLGNLACTGDACTPAAPGTTPTANPAAVAIAASKLLFNEVRTDFMTLFSKGGLSGAGGVNVQAMKFSEAMKGVQAPVQLLVKDAGAILAAIDYFNDFKSGRTVEANRTFAPGAFSIAGPVSSSIDAVRCSVSANADGTPSSLPDAAALASVVCSIVYHSTLASGLLTEWQHVVIVKPATSSVGGFEYLSRARSRAYGGPSPSISFTTTNLSERADGTVSTTTDANGSVIGFTLAGSVAPAFVDGGSALADAGGTWELSGTRAIAAANTVTSTVAGNIVSKAADGSTRATLTIKSGSLSEIPVARLGGQIVRPGTAGSVGAGGEISAGALDVVWTTPGAEFEGGFSATDSAWTKNGTAHAPTKLALSGALRTIDSGVKTEFAGGTLTATVSGLADYDESQPATATNTVTVGLAFAGKVTAPNRPTLDVSLGASQKAYDGAPVAVTMQYRTIVAGKPRNSIRVDVSRSASGAAVLALSEAASNVSVTLVEGAASADLLLGSNTKIGELNTGSGVMTYSDGSFQTLDVGL